MKLMLKDIPVLEIEEGARCRIMNYDLLPHILRKPDVNIEDYLFQWVQNRVLPIDRSNAKKLLNSLRISQVNKYKICLECHGLSLMDCYWIREDSEGLQWRDVNLYNNSLSTALASIALTGTSRITIEGKVRTPEFTTQGLGAKCWVREDDGIYLYKVGRKEWACSQVLDALSISHVSYTPAKINEENRDILTEELQNRMEEAGEVVVKSRLLTDEKTAIVPFEDFQVYCEYHDMDAFAEVLRIDRRHYMEMQAADYLLNNSDRHGLNWGFYMDNTTGGLTGLHPLFDHDHALDESKDIPSQTTEEKLSLKDAAVIAQRELHLPVERLFNMERPKGMTEEEWDGVRSRARVLVTNK